MPDYSRLTATELQEILSRNPRDTPHYIKAKDELTLRGLPNYQPYPKWLFHPDKPEGKIFNSFEEAKGLEKKGWVDSPARLQRTPSRFAVLLEKKIQPWWSKWSWAFAALAVIVGILLGIKNLTK